MRNHKKILLIAAALALAGANPAFAGKTKDELEKDGYSCGRAGVGGYECTKDGAKTFLCDNAGKCESLLVLDPGGGKKFPKANFDGSASPKLLNKSPN